MSDRNRLRELCARATPGPWLADGVNVRGPARVSASNPQGITDIAHLALTVGHYQTEAKNAEFIAAARQALPDLLDRIDAVLALHYADPDDTDTCWHCGGEYPCPTVRALTGDNPPPNA